MTAHQSVLLSWRLWTTDNFSALLHRSIGEGSNNNNDLTAHNFHLRSILVVAVGHVC